MDYEFDYEVPVNADAGPNYELSEPDLSDYFTQLAEEGL